MGMSDALSVAEQRDRLRVENRRLVVEKDELTVQNGQLITRTDELDTKLRELTKKLELYEEELAWFKHKLYGRGTEQLTAAELLQIRLFDEIDSAADADAETDEGAEDQPAPDQPATEALAPTGRRPRRKPLPQSLPRVEQLIDLPEQDKQCACGHQLVRIGQECSEKLDVIPPQVRVIRTVRPTYACHHCEGSGDEDHPAVRTAPPPPALIPKGLATEGLLAFIATAKFCDALPLYRQERQFARLGVELSRRTMADWMIAAAGACGPVMELLSEHLHAGPVLQIDETTVQVLKEPGRANTTTSYLWVARGGPPQTPVVRYRYEPSRGAWVAAEIIGDYQGYVQTDGYEGYDDPCSQPGIRHVGCWSHARRPFKDAATALSKVSKRAGAALQALGFIAALYRAESQLGEHRDDDPEGFVAARRAQVEPVLEKFHGWLQQKNDQVLPGSALGQAVAYTLVEWPKLIRYLEHAQLRPDTNACEQAIRPFVVGRKNWLFSGSPRGAAASATLYSLIETAKANGHEPYWYLRELFQKLPHARTRADYLSLLPTARPPPTS